jgi:hypothetical protein
MATSTINHTHTVNTLLLLITSAWPRSPRWPTSARPGRWLSHPSAALRPARDVWSGTAASPLQRSFAATGTSRLLKPSHQRRRWCVFWASTALSCGTHRVAISLPRGGLSRRGLHLRSGAETVPLSFCVRGPCHERAPRGAGGHRGRSVATVPRSTFSRAPCSSFVRGRWSSFAERGATLGFRQPGDCVR